MIGDICCENAAAVTVSTGLLLCLLLVSVTVFTEMSQFNQNAQII